MSGEEFRIEFRRLWERVKASGDIPVGVVVFELELAKCEAMDLYRLTVVKAQQRDLASKIIPAPSSALQPNHKPGQGRHD